MAAIPTRGDVWLVDLGMVAKVRPCLVLSIPADDQHDRVLATLVPHTTSTRISRFEVISSVRFLKPGAFDAQKRSCGVRRVAEFEKAKSVSRQLRHSGIHTEIHTARMHNE